MLKIYIASPSGHQIAGYVSHVTVTIRYKKRLCL